jgi:hypothetical protein
MAYGLFGFGHGPEPDEIWELAIPIPGLDSRHFRNDELGNLICRFSYGDRRSPYGWEIDYRIPMAPVGFARDRNFRPLHWRANASLGGILAGLGH